MPDGREQGSRLIRMLLAQKRGYRGSDTRMTILFETSCQFPFWVARSSVRKRLPFSIRSLGRYCEFLSKN